MLWDKFICKAVVSSALGDRFDSCLEHINFEKWAWANPEDSSWKLFRSLLGSLFAVSCRINMTCENS